MSETSMLLAADRLKTLRDEKAELQARLKDVQESIDSVEAELIQYMTDEECTGFDRNGTRFSLVIREFPGAVPEERDELYRRMRSHGFEHLFTINTNTLAAGGPPRRSSRGSSTRFWGPSRPFRTHVPYRKAGFGDFDTGRA